MSGKKGYWSHSYYTLKYLVNLYQVSSKAKGEEMKVNFNNSDELDLI